MAYRRGQLVVVETLRALVLVKSKSLTPRLGRFEERDSRQNNENEKRWEGERIRNEQLPGFHKELFMAEGGHVDAPFGCPMG